MPAILIRIKNHTSTRQNHKRLRYFWSSYENTRKTQIKNVKAHSEKCGCDVFLCMCRCRQTKERVCLDLDLECGFYRFSPFCIRILRVSKQQERLWWQMHMAKKEKKDWRLIASRWKITYKWYSRTPIYGVDRIDYAEKNRERKCQCIYLCSVNAIIYYIYARGIGTQNE